MSRVKQASFLFKKGFNCAQSVLSSFRDFSDISDESLLKISSGLGAGMGRLQQTCGAVTGAYLVAGLLYGYTKADDKASKENTYDIIKQFDKKFRKVHGTTSCRELLGCDINTEAGMKYFNDNNLSDKVCKKCVRDSVKILNEIL